MKEATRVVTCPICSGSGEWIDAEGDELPCQCCQKGKLVVPEKEERFEQMLNLDRDLLRRILTEWDPMQEISEGGCADGFSSYGWEINGICPDCEEPTIDGDAARGCNYSPINCETCGHRYCDWSC